MQRPKLPFQDPDLPFEQRARDLTSRLTLEEKASQMLHEAPGIERLGIPAYNWWNECIHGVGRAGIATVFPQAIALAAIWSIERITQVATAIGDEARAKHHECLRHDDHGMYKGLTYFAPNINIFRDPRWGRGHETYGECPHLTGRLAVAFCKAMQGDDDKYLKLVATPKHYAVHSGPEHLRHSFNAIASEKDLWETYLPAFFDCITEAQAHSIMGAYNRTNGEPCSASQRLLVDVLRGKWGFQGYVVSDCWAVRDFHESHAVTKTPEESAALSVKMGCDLNCGCTFEHLPNAVSQGLLSEEEIDVSLTRLMLARLRLGMFDPPERVPYASIPYEVNACDEHQELAITAARESLVLLKNDGTLPLRRDVKNIAVIGPNADAPDVLLGDYAGVPSGTVTPLEAIAAAVSKNTRVWYTNGCNHTGTQLDGLRRSGNVSEAVSMAQRADVVVMCLGLSVEIEGEQGDIGNSAVGGDKADLELTGLQHLILEEVTALGKPVVLVLIAGSPVNLSWAHENVNAILDAWYPGARGGVAIADALFGDCNPGGRLPVTFPRSIDDVPDITDYRMAGRTYRYATTEPLYPFGYGLSYTTFEYSDLTLSESRTRGDDPVDVSVRVTNTGDRSGDEVTQLYVEDVEASCPVPVRQLRGFRRVSLAPGQSTTLRFSLSPRDLSLIDEQGQRVLEPGTFRVSVGGSQPDERSAALMGRTPLVAELVVEGAARTLPY